jgi:hypothetical protein
MVKQVPDFSSGHILRMGGMTAADALALCKVGTARDLLISGVIKWLSKSDLELIDVINA